MAKNESDHCPECGAQVMDGREGCQALWEALSVQAYNDPGYASVQTLALDTYCMQHPAKYCVSAKSYAAHLTRLCCGLEYRGEPSIYAAIQRWLSRNPMLTKPEVLTNVGTLTIADVLTAQNLAEHTKQVWGWAENVWEAYASQQARARTWIQQALS